MTVAADASEPLSHQAIFQPWEHVHDLLPDGSEFGDPVWDYTSLARPSQAERRIDVSSIEGPYGGTARHLLMLQGRPSHPQVLEAGVVLRAKPAPLSTLIDQFLRLRILARWGEARSLSSFAEWSQGDVDLFVSDMHLGRHRPNGEAVGPSGMRGYITTIKDLHNFAAVLPNTLTFAPWPHRSAAKIAGEVKNIENDTAPLRWETWAPLVTASWALVDRFSPDIIAIQIALRSALTSGQLGRGGTADEGVQLLEAYFLAGGRVPLHTGFGKSGSMPRGTANLAMLCRLTGVSGNIFRRTHRTFRQRARDLVEQAVTNGQGVLGGLIVPSVRVAGEGGVTGPWIDEVGMGEAEYLPSVLRGACYVIIACLSGMRDSEIQDLKRDAWRKRGELEVLSSRQYKGNGEFLGMERDWWVPEQVVKCIDVLSQLSHDEYLFARANRAEDNANPTAYNPYRDIKRVIDFVNTNPQDRAGRGNGLGLETIAQSRGQSINATSLRRTFAVYAATYPGAELGLGIQLGHLGRRITSSYMSDGQQQAVRMLNESREELVRNQVDRLVNSNVPLAGEGSLPLRSVRVQIVTDPARAAQLRDQLAENYHLGITNDCMYRSALAACGDDGPHLANHFCAGSNCPNAVVHDGHAAALRAHIARLDNALDAPVLHPAFEASIRADRVDVVTMLETIDTKEPSA